MGALERQQSRRDSGVATLSVLTTPEPFLEWARSAGFVTLMCTHSDPHSAVAAHTVSSTPTSTVHEQRVVARRYQALDPRWGRVAEAVLKPGSHVDPEEVAAFVRWLDKIPAVIVDWTRATPTDEQLRSLTRACLRTPRLPLAVAVQASHLPRWLSLGHSTSQALVSEGLVSDEALDPAAVARSRAELALFRALEEATQTRGAFHLNARQPWLFGDREVEIDLYAPRWRLAIELDGYYHFREPDNFRRDRRKDLEYQLHDIVVFRVLAEDVEEDVSNTVSRIVRLIERLEIQPT